ncbi:SAMS2 [Symbiodinium pilosum]|uniref:SAMS2 protein n=1 Tax=Symbiodinium pilosum TaxID=2952 RepID=A0A812IU22_SYMPI|nr:SAMS2 [Symbiodinium pilosum]
MAPPPFRLPMQAWEAPPQVAEEEYPEEVNDILREIQGYVFTRRIRAKDFFLDFDPLRCGRCSPHQFVRGLNAIVPHLRSDKMRILTDFFTEPSHDAMKPQVVRHLDFLRSVDHVFGASELERQPAVKAPRPGHCLKKHGADIGPCDDEAAVEQTLRRLALLVKTRGVIFSKCFQDSERSLDTSLLCPRFAGKVTEAQFCSHFPFMQDISEYELNLLLQRYYNADTGGISYVALDKEIQALIDEPCQGSVQHPQTARTHTSRQWTGPATWSGRESMRLPFGQDPDQLDEELLMRLKAEIASRRLRLHGSFQEVDRLRRGAVSMGQARTVFTILRIELDSKELEMLQRIFNLNGLFNYKQFCNAVLEVPLDSDCVDLGPALFKKSERVRVRHRLKPDAEEQLAEAESVMVLIEGRRREPHLDNKQKDKQRSSLGVEKRRHQKLPLARLLQRHQHHLVFCHQLGEVPSMVLQAAAPRPSPPAAAVIAALVAAQQAQAAPPGSASPQIAALTAAIAAARQAAPGAAAPTGAPAAVPGAAAAPGTQPQLTALIAALAQQGAGAGAPPTPTAPTAPLAAPTQPPPAPNPQAAAILATLQNATTAPAQNPQSAALVAALAQNPPAAPPNPQALAILSALGAPSAAGAAPTAAAGATGAAGVPPASSLSPQAAAVIAALVAAKSAAPATLPAQPLLGLAPQTTAGTAAPPNASGQIDIIAHLAASARINAAMNAAYSPPEEQQPVPPAPEPAAFDKDALRRLAQRAAEGPIEDEPPPPPPPEPVPKVAAMPEAEQDKDIDEPAADTTSDAAVAVPAAPAQDDETNGSIPAAAEVEVKKKDSSSIATMLSYAQSNVAKGKVPSDKTVDTASLQQAFTIGGGASGHASSGLKGLSPVESLCQRLDSAGSDLPSEERKDLQQQITAILPKLEPPKVAELVSRLQGAEGIRSSQFLDEVAKALHPSRFTSSHLTRMMASLATWAAAVSGSDADGKIKLSEDARSFFTTSAAELSLRLMDVAPKDLSQIATAMATIGMTEERFFASLARASVARCERFSVEEILMVCVAFDKAGMVHIPLLEAAGKLLRLQVAQVPGEDLSKGLRSLATCCVRDLALGRAVGEYLAEGPKGGLTPEEFCSLAWTFVNLGFYHDQMFRAVFKALEDAPTMPGDTLCQLYEIHLALKAFRNDLYGKYELEESAVQSLRAHYRKHRGGKVRDVKLERSVEKVCKDIAECLQKVVSGSISRQHQTELGMAVDIAVSAKRGSRPIVFIEVDGSHSLMKTLDLTGPATSQISRVRGPVLLKRYLLQKHGFRIAVVPEDFWRSLPDSREKRAYCDASGREFSYLDFCNSFRRRASESGSGLRRVCHVSQPSRYFTRKGKVIPLARQAPLSARPKTR